MDNTTQPADDPEIEAALANLPPEFYDQPPEIRAIDLAMIHAKGNVTLVGPAVGMELRELKRAVRRNPYLKARWIKEAPKRPDMLPAVVPTGQQLEKTLEETTAEYHAELQTIAAEPEQADLGARLFKVQMKHGLHGMALLGGGMQRAAMQLISMIDNLKNNPYPDEYTADGILLRSGQRETDSMIIKAQSEYGRRSTEYAQITMMTAKTQQIMGAGKGGSGGGGNQPNQKPGFQPMKAPTQVLAQAGSTVVLNQGGSNGSQTKT